jgi:hypothetical protein
MAIRKTYIKSDPRRAILTLTALAIVVSGLFPPWIFVFDRTGTSDSRGGHSEWSAGYKFIFRPPNPSDEFDFALKESDRFAFGNSGSNGGIKLDVARLMVGWVCILAASGAVWGLVRLNRESNSSESACAAGRSATAPPLDR